MQPNLNMNSRSSYINQHPVYPGEYIPSPEVQIELEELQMSNECLPLNPLLNIDEFEDCYKIIAVIPGVSRENIFIDVRNKLLSITVLHRDEEPGRKEFRIHEFEGKYFQRRITLPYNADPVFVSSEYKDGILHICIPKSKNPIISFSSRIVTY